MNNNRHDRYRNGEQDHWQKAKNHFMSGMNVLHWVVMNDLKMAQESIQVLMEEVKQQVRNVNDLNKRFLIIQKGYEKRSGDLEKALLNEKEGRIRGHTKESVKKAKVFSLF